MTEASADWSAYRQRSAMVFVNSDAGGGHAQNHLSGLQKLFEARHLQVQFVMTGSAEDLETRVRDAIVHNHRLLLALGGDGTFQALANSALGADVLVGILPAGGGNDFAAALGLPADPIKAAEAILRGGMRRVDMVKVHTADGRVRFYAGGGGVGLDAEAARFASGAYRHFPGRSRYLASAVHALIGYRPVKVRLDFPGSEHAPVESKALIAAVLNTPTYGAGLRFAEEARIDDGLLDVVLVEDLSLFNVFALLPRLMANGELRTPRVQRWRVPRLRLASDPPSLFHGDGEILGSTPLDIEVAPRAIRLLAPLHR